MSKKILLFNIKFNFMKRMVLMIATVAIFVLGTSFSASKGGMVKVSP